MDYSLISITDTRFNSLSDVVLANIEYLTTLINGTATDDSLEQASALPKKHNLADLTNPDSTPIQVLSAISSLIEAEETDNMFCTLAGYYPNGGFIGWHTNSNFNLYNAICTFSDTGESYFEYIQDGEVITIQDAVGWRVKKSYWNSDTPITHRAVSNCNRITITFSSKQESNVDEFITKITS